MAVFGYCLFKSYGDYFCPCHFCDDVDFCVHLVVDPVRKHVRALTRELVLDHCYKHRQNPCTMCRTAEITEVWSSMSVEIKEEADE